MYLFSRDHVRRRHRCLSEIQFERWHAKIISNCRVVCKLGCRQQFIPIILMVGAITKYIVLDSFHDLSLRVFTRGHFQLNSTGFHQMVPNLDVHFGSWSDVILSGIPYCLKIFEKKE